MPDAVSLVLPVVDHREVPCARLLAVREALSAIFSYVEIVLVDDGERNAGAEIKQRLPEARVLRNRRNLGKGASIALGLAAARGRWAIYTDGDVPFDVASYQRLGRTLVEGAKLAMGNRRRSESQILLRFDSLRYVAYRHVVGLAFNRAVKIVTGLPWADTQCGLKGFERAFGLTLFARARDPGFLFDIELLLAARALGVSPEEVPVCVIYDDTRSTLGLRKDLRRTGRGLAAIAWRRARGDYGAPAERTLLERFRNASHDVIDCPGDATSSSERR